MPDGLANGGDVPLSVEILEAVRCALKFTQPRRFEQAPRRKATVGLALREQREEPADACRPSIDGSPLTASCMAAAAHRRAIEGERQYFDVAADPAHRAHDILDDVGVLARRRRGGQGGLGGSPEPISAPRRSGSQSRRHRSRLRQAGKGRADPGHGKRETAELPRVEWARRRSKSSRAPALPERNDRPRGARSPPHICRLTPRRRGPHPHWKPASGACSPNTTPSKRKGRSGVSVTKSR